MLSICRTLFFIVILFITVFLGTNYNKINISTNLKDLSPTLSNEPSIQRAITTLSQDIESRFILIINSKNKERTEKAAEELKKALKNIENIAIDSLSLDVFLKNLSEYRFQLLAPEQSQLIKNSSVAELTEQAQRNLYRMDASLQFIAIDKDPLSTFDSFINHLLETQIANNNTTQRLVNNGETLFYQAIPVVIAQGAMQIEKQHHLLKAINTLDKAITEQFSVEILRSGVFFFAADAAEKSESDIKSISTISTIGIIVLLLFVFRSLSILALPILSIGVGIIFAVAVNHSFYHSIHILTIVFGASLIGIIIDYSLHYFYHRQTHPDKEKNLNNTVKLYRAMVLSLLTSLVGYSALSFSSLDALRKVALFSCCGIFAAWLSVITIGSLSKISNITTSDTLFSSLLATINRGLTLMTSKLSLPLWAGIIIVGSALLYFIELPTNDNPHLFFKPAEHLLAQEKKAKQFSDKVEPGRYFVITGDSTEAVYHKFNALSQLIKKELNVDASSVLFSAMQLLPSPQQQRENHQLQEKIYQAGGVASAFFNSLGIAPQQADELYKEYKESAGKEIDPSRLFGLQDNNSGFPPVWIPDGKKIVAFAMIKKGNNADQLERMTRQNKDKLNGVIFINTLALSQQSLKQQRSSASVLLTLAYLFIAAMMLLYYRSIQALWVLLVPLTATLGTLAIMTAFSINITLFNVMGLFLVLGLGMDYVIFIKEMDNDNSTTQNAILLSSITTLLSFGLLSLSNIPVAQAFGTTLLIGNSLNFLAALIYAQLNKTTQAASC